MKPLEEIDAAVKALFNEHPFTFGISPQNVGSVLANYLAMSQAFPYLQAGAQANLILQAMDRNIPVPLEVEWTSVVANFLCWDETGGHHILMEEGIAALPSILNTHSNFHANHLKRDIAALLGRETAPFYSAVTKRYLKNLFDGLSSCDHLRRAAYMVAFEQHAGEMIEALWRSLVALFPVNRDELVYFRLHVGGHDPAEVYHIEMTRAMIERLIKSDADLDAFLEHFLEAYSDNIAWCDAIKHFEDREPRAGTRRAAWLAKAKQAEPAALGKSA
ncbi:MAG: hypothetical protein ACJ8J7_15535 [Sulfurifustaceae bacterium]